MGKCALETFSLESDQSLPLELAKHDPLDRPEVVIGVCIALRDLVHTFSPKVASLELEEGGGQNRGSDGATLTSSTDVKKNLFFKQIGSGCSSDGVYIPFTGITVRNGEKKYMRKYKMRPISPPIS